MGLSNLGATLAARVDGPFPIYLINAPRFPFSAIGWLVPPANTPDLNYFPVVFPIEEPNTFPYGIAVEPDSPV